MEGEYISKEAVLSFITMVAEGVSAPTDKGLFGRIIGEGVSVAIKSSLAEIATGVAQLPAADVAPVRHARWVEHIDDYENSCKCDICGFMPDSPLDETDYCPNCGAKMC